ncbi:MAG: hypothetical protein JFAIHJKO_02790 [Pyrinomonadaceae bacterium]|nr:hypothetical protein [Pyrinomonadaceae bacterium]
MPVPKRYFHVSQELNHDPELWEFTSEFGDRSLRTWLQILVYLDRSANQWRTSGDWLATLSRTVRQSSANLSRQIGWLVAKQWLVIRESSADGSPLVFEAPKWAEYNKRQEHKRNNSVPDSGTKKERIDIPSFPTPTPSLSYSFPKNKKEEEKIRIKSSATPVGEREPVVSRTGPTWDAYAQAYRNRYGADPLRNAKTNGQLSNFLKRVPIEEAPLIAAFYLTHNKPMYVSARHSTDFLLRDAEGLRTEWVTGVKATTGEARNAEQRDNVSEQYKRVMASMEVKHG